MKHLTLLALCAVTIFSACKKKSDPDPRDQYVGTWTESINVTILDISYSDISVDTVKIVKAENTTNKINFTDQTGKTTVRVATVDGNTITFDPTTYTGISNGKQISVTLKGTGTIAGGKAMSVTTGKVTTSKDGKDYSGTWVGGWSKL